MNDGINLDKIRVWLQNYGAGDFDDKRNIENCVICETDEFLNPFIAQLHAVARGEIDEELLDKIIGLKRKAKFGAYDRWAQLMVLWIQEAKKKA